MLHMITSTMCNVCNINTGTSGALYILVNSIDAAICGLGLVLGVTGVTNNSTVGFTSHTAQPHRTPPRPTPNPTAQ